MQTARASILGLDCNTIPAYKSSLAGVLGSGGANDQKYIKKYIRIRKEILLKEGKRERIR